VHDELAEDNHSNGMARLDIDINGEQRLRSEFRADSLSWRDRKWRSIFDASQCQGSAITISNKVLTFK
jgi:hypothetical protein